MVVSRCGLWLPGRGETGELMLCQVRSGRSVEYVELMSLEVQNCSKEKRAESGPVTRAARNGSGNGPV